MNRPMRKGASGGVGSCDYIPQQPHARHVALDERVIMPNHGHGILRLLVDPAETPPETDGPHGPLSGSVMSGN
jgi:hypothetical protein